MKDCAEARRRANLKRLLTPRHIAFVGGRAVEDCINATRKSGFAGDIWVVHPKYEELAGVACVPSLADLPEPPDATLIAVSRERTVDVVAELNAMGAGGAVSIVGEFAETGEDGAALQARLVTAAGDLALVGPNCLGVMNMFDDMAVWGGDNVFSPVTGDGVALISQSGYVAYSVTNVEQALPLGYAISMGNQAVLNVADYIDAMLDDPRVRAIGLYLEGIVDIAAFSAAALRAVGQGVPLVALKAGGTQESAELAQSHSGTLAVDNEIWSALFRRLAIVEAGSPKALIETLKLLGSPKPPKGNRIVAAANSGGYAAMIGEKGRAVGLEFPAPTQVQRNALRQTVPELVSLMNPLDWNLPWAAMSTPDTSDNGMGILMDDRCDLLVYFVDWPREPDVAEVWWPTLEGLIQLNGRMECPVVIASVFPDGLPADLRLRLADAGVVTLQGLDDTLSAFSAAARYPVLRAQVLADPESRLLPVPVRNTASAVTLNEAEGKALLAEHGLPVPVYATGTAEEVIAAADRVGYPLAVKLLNADLAHKNQAGAVHLNINDIAGLEYAISAIQASVTRYDARLDTGQFLIERMVSAPRAEFIAGVSHKPGLGHALIIGCGGTAVEELRDFTTLLLPASSAQINDALLGLHLTRKLRLRDGEVAALTRIIVNIAQFADANRDRLVELDVNPILLDAQGGVTAVDAYLRISD
ncbi:acetate--CoA ligase family protein [Ruegeria atlantica]|uniref:acetate--CoA ligase family protein n=1 Tax=Ruegeria atlantica TaxID=81569 RepID=UPI001481A588|nr:acetate--CoA ligase family protein [Ruegeria atlantica]